jgi:tetratricopeptide (TPR) repeat protein
MEGLSHMHKKIFSFFLLIICFASISFAADPFYTNLLNEGKQLYIAGKYVEALENFKIAEFGLIDEKEFISELYFFYALTQYKKGAMEESKALMEKMKSILGPDDMGKVAKPKEIERDLSIMMRALDYLGQPGAKPGSLAFFNLFYETWDLLKAKKLEAAETNLKRLDKMNGDEKRVYFLEGLLAFQKSDYKRCVKVMEKIGLVLPAEFGEDASFCLAYSHLKRGNSEMGEKYARLIKDPEHIHSLMLLMDEIKAGTKGPRPGEHQEKGKNE